VRRTVLIVLAAVAAVVALGAVAVAAGGGSSVTRPRLERALPATFANLYVQQADLLGKQGITPESMKATAMCDKGGPRGADVGPGGDWVCLMSWHDPSVPMPTEGYGKFELNVHSNDCFTASGPSKLTGFMTLTDQHGREVPNPLFEFDGCFDPHGDNNPTGVEYPSLLSATAITVTPDARGRVAFPVACGTGAEGCAGTVTAVSGGTRLGRVPFDLVEESTAALTLPQSLPAGAKDVEFTVHATTGVGPTSPVTLTVQQRGG
jgi:hypothetical protein